MVITQINGGLGNQMFQYAAGRALAHRLNTELKLDISAFKDDKLRKYGLDCFNIIQASFMTQQRVNKIKKHSYRLFKFLPPILKKATFPLARLTQEVFFKEKHFYEKHFHFDPAFFQLEGNIYLHGGWHSEKYFKDIETIIRKDFSFKTPPDSKNKKMLERISESNSVSIHVRRGDYLTTAAKCWMLSLDFYQKAINLIKDKIANPNFFVFSDDLDWCQTNLKINLC